MIYWRTMEKENSGIISVELNEDGSHAFRAAGEVFGFSSNDLASVDWDWDDANLFIRLGDIKLKMVSWDQEGIVFKRVKVFR